jgi:hypothetical protein
MLRRRLGAGLAQSLTADGALGCGRGHMRSGPHQSPCSPAHALTADSVAQRCPRTERQRRSELRASSLSGIGTPRRTPTSNRPGPAAERCVSAVAPRLNR